MSNVQAFAATCREGFNNGVAACGKGWTACVEGAKTGFEAASRVAVEWKGHIVRDLNNVSTFIHTHSFVQIGLVIAINTLFFLAINEILRRVNRSLENQADPIKEEHRFSKQVFVNVILPGAAMVGFNALLALATPISGWLVVGMTVAAIAARLLLNRYSISEHRTAANIDRDIANNRARLTHQVEVDRLNQQIIALQGERDGLQGRVNNFNNEKASLEEQVNALTEQIHGRDQEIVGLKGRITELNTNINTQTDKNQRLLEELGIIQRQHTALQNEFDKQNAEVEKKYEKLNADYKDLERQYEELKQEKNQLASDLDQTKLECETLKTNYKELENMYSQATGKDVPPALSSSTSSLPSTPVKGGTNGSSAGNAFVVALGNLLGIGTPPASPSITPPTATASINNTF